MASTSSVSGSTSITGLVSGVDTDTLVTSLMKVAARPQALLTKTLGTVNSALTALQSLNTQTSALATAAKAMAQPSAYAALTAASSDTAVAKTTLNGTPTAATSLDLTVDRLASAHSTIGPAWTTGSTPSGSAEFSITHQDGTVKTVTAVSSSPADIAAAINDRTSGDPSVSATVVSSSDGTQRLVVTSTGTGAQSQFTLARGDGSTYGTTAQAGADARVHLGDGSVVTSATNTFTGLMTGVDVTVLKTGPVAVSTAKDSAGVTDKVADLVSKVNTLVGLIATNTASTPGSAGSEAKRNPLTGELQVINLRTELLSTASGSLGAVAPSDAGVSVDRSGNLTFDKTAFATLLEKDPARAQAVISGLSEKLSAIATRYSDPYEGTLSVMIKSDKQRATDLGSSIDAWTDRLALRSAALKAQFSAMESTLSRLQTQGSALSAALSSTSRD